MRINPKYWYLMEEYQGWPLCSLDDFMYARANSFTREVGTPLNSILVYKGKTAYMLINKRKWSRYKDFFSALLLTRLGYFEKIYDRAEKYLKKWQVLNTKVIRLQRLGKLDKKTFNQWRAALVDVALVGQPMNFVEFGEAKLSSHLKTHLKLLIPQNEVERAFITLTNPFKRKKALLLAGKLKLTSDKLRLFELVRRAMISKNERYKIFVGFSNRLLGILGHFTSRPLTAGKFYLTADEIINKDRPRIVADRRGILYSRNSRYLVDSRQSKALIDSLYPAIVNKGLIHGQCAMTGCLRGRVTLLLNVKDLKKMKKGNIAVAHTATVDLLPAMRLAAAIITDMGGITSHAAIVSRELGIPCVIGTKIATRIFKDGDRVEVDATRGIVRKI